MVFPCTNKIFKYETLINGMKITIEWKMDELKIFGDLQLFINQVNDIYQMKDEKIAPYKLMVNHL